MSPSHRPTPRHYTKHLISSSAASAAVPTQRRPLPTCQSLRGTFGSVVPVWTKNMQTSSLNSRKKHALRWLSVSKRRFRSDSSRRLLGSNASKRHWCDAKTKNYRSRRRDKGGSNRPEAAPKFHRTAQKTMARTLWPGPSGHQSKRKLVW